MSHQHSSNIQKVRGRERTGGGGGGGNRNRSDPLQDLLETEHRAVAKLRLSRRQSRGNGGGRGISSAANSAVAQVILSQTEQKRKKDLELTKARAKFFAEEAAEQMSLSGSVRESPVNVPKQHQSDHSSRIVRKSSSSSYHSSASTRKYSQTRTVPSSSTTSHSNDYSNKSQTRKALSSSSYSSSKRDVPQVKHHISSEVRLLYYLFVIIFWFIYGINF